MQMKKQEVINMLKELWIDLYHYVGTGEFDEFAEITDKQLNALRQAIKLLEREK